jgi:hypothetical protein
MAGDGQEESGSATVRNCVIRDNTSPDAGAGVSCQGVNCSPTFNHCWFIGNVSDPGSGTAWLAYHSSPRFESCYFLNNMGWGCIAIESSGLFVDCIFSGGAFGGWGAVFALGSTLTLTSCTITDLGPSQDYDVAEAYDQGNLVFENTIIAWNHAATTIRCDNTSAVTLTCSDIYGNAGGDWVGSIASQLGQDGNICLDPQFCSDSPSEDLDWSIHSESPCAPAQSGCGLIGAEDVGCGPTPAETRTWGGVKLLFRE